MQGLVVLNSSWGGRSRLQRALCLDSLARTDEAKELYQQIRNHPEVRAPGQPSPARQLASLTPLRKHC